jgi:hypothetical protein
VPLPLVLVGPIVRRVDSRMASVFIALSRPASVELRVWEGVQVARAGQPGIVRSGAAPVATGMGRTRRFGENLHVAVAVADLVSPLLPGRRHSYDLLMTPDGGEPSNLRSHGLLAEGRIVGSDPEAPASLPLGYDEDVLPGFMTCPARIEDLRLVQTGCRCTDAAGDDAMAYIDDLIGSRIEGSTPPPHQLVLTGDQIYADRVAAPLLPIVNALGREMLGGSTEELPLNDTESLIVDTDRLPPLHRRRICSLDAKLSCNSGHSHVFSLAEYCGLYALCWSTSVWREIPGLDAFPDLTGIGPQHRAHLTDYETRLADRPAEAKAKMGELRTRWADETQSARVFRAALAKVARVLANVPTYMLFDDHEITDDWNLTARHRRRTLESLLGRRLILNAVSAATVFQAWGNDPRSFEPPPGGPDTANARLLTAVLDGDRETARALVGLRAELPDVPVRFGFSVDGPAHRLIAIDTRSHRDFPSDTGPPALAPPEQIDDQIPEGPLPAGLEALFVLSPAPVVHPPLVDTIGQPLAAAIIDLVSVARGEDEDPGHPEGRQPDTPLLGSAKTEVELWYGDRRAYDHLLERLSTYPRVVILSGDVHFSVSLAIDTWLVRNLPGASSRILQLTGSAARNHWEPIVELVLRAFRPFQDLLHLDTATEFSTTLTEAIADTAATSVGVATPAPSALQGEPFRIRVDGETMLATAGPGGASPWQVERGVAGSAAAIHEKDAPVRHVSARATVLKWDRGDVPPVEGVHGRRYLELKLEEVPVRVPATGWPRGSVQRREADFAYRLALLSDRRPDAERSTQLGALLPPFPEIDPADPLDGYGLTLQRHQAALRNSAQVRTLVYPHNISEVYFAAEPETGALRVIHDLYGRLHHAAAGVRAEVLTRHESSLEPVDDPRPTIEIET